MLIACGLVLIASFWRHDVPLVVEHFATVSHQYDADLLFRGGKDLELHHTFANLIDVKDQILGCNLHNTQFAIGHEILHKLLLFVRHQPCEVGLVLSVYSRHQLYIGSEDSLLLLLRGLWRESIVIHLTFPAALGGCHGCLIGEVAIPCTSEVAVAPCPLLLSWREMMTCHVQHARLSIVLVASLEVEAAVHAHIACRNGDVLIV